MVDRFSSEVRSKIMSKIRGKWTASEKIIHNFLKGNKIKHTMHPKLPGNPDVFLKDFNAVVFIDGCFWHNCPKHGHIPESNVKYWKQKIKRNVKRDLKNTKALEKEGFKVIRIWEHDIVMDNFNVKIIQDRLR